MITRLRELAEEGYSVHEVNAVVLAGMGGMKCLLDVLSYKLDTSRLRQACFWWINRKQSRPNLWCWLVRHDVWAFSRLALVFELTRDINWCQIPIYSRWTQSWRWRRSMT
jgi:hypothetical protein